MVKHHALDRISGYFGMVLDTEYNAIRTIVIFQELNDVGQFSFDWQDSTCPRIHSVQVGDYGEMMRLVVFGM